MAHLEQETAVRSHHGGRQVDVTVHVTDHATQSFPIGGEATLLQLMERAAALAGVALLPPGQAPFDILHQMNGEHVGAALGHLDLMLAEYLRHSENSPHFTVELARAIHVNRRWDVAPRPEMTPREILALPRIHLDASKYTLYLPESTIELPLDTPIKLVRGTDLEAQADGKYGGGR